MLKGKCAAIRPILLAVAMFAGEPFIARNGINIHTTTGWLLSGYFVMCVVCSCARYDRGTRCHCHLDNSVRCSYHVRKHLQYLEVVTCSTSWILLFLLPPVNPSTHIVSGVFPFCHTARQLVTHTHVIRVLSMWCVCACCLSCVRCHWVYVLW